jgi:glycosyltransferase involved in cell wall biosynthesis
MPVLSIITINLNNKTGLERTIQSVIKQTNRNFEFIVIDGESTDGSVELIEKYANYIDIKLVEKDTGIFNAMNKGIKLASNEYLLFLNSADTLINDGVINESLKWLDGTDIVVGLTEYQYKDGKNTKTKLPETICDLNFLIKASLPHQSTFIRKELLMDGYDESLRLSADWKFFVEAICIKRCTLKAIDICLTKFDMNGISTNEANYDLIDAEKGKVLWELFRYNYNGWKIDKARILTADYYEKKLIIKLLYFYKKLFYIKSLS